MKNISNGINNPLLNFTALAGPARNAGSDGKDIGWLFGKASTLNWMNSRNVNLPCIVKMRIMTSAAVPSGKVFIELNANKTNQ